MNAQPLTHDRLRALVPSAFAVEPWQGMSEKYRMIPTIDVLTHLENHGFVPVSAQQGRTRIPGKADFTKHVIRLQHENYRVGTPNGQVGAIIPQILLSNAHDGTSAYKIMLAMFRVACLNGLCVSSGDINEISVRHTGPETLAEDVLDASYTVIDQTPVAVKQITDWSAKLLTHDQTVAYAEAALELSDNQLKPSVEQVLRPRRYDDNGSDVWRTMNRIQENLVKGGQLTRNAQGARRHVRPIRSVNEDIRLNRALWKLTEALTAQI